MSKAILTFDLSDKDDNDTFKVTSQADSMYFALWELENGIGRSIYKYHTDTVYDEIHELLKYLPKETREEVLEKFLDLSEKWHNAIYETVRDNGVDLEIYP